MFKWAARLTFFRRKKLLLVLLVLIITGGVTYFFIHRNNETKIANTGATPKQVERTLDKNKDKLLQEKNYDLFQATQQGLAEQYLANNDPKNAEKVMNDVVTSVPKDKIRVDVYMELWNIAKKQDNSTAAKQYAQKVVDMLKAQGDQKEVDQWSKEL